MKSVLPRDSVLTHQKYRYQWDLCLCTYVIGNQKQEFQKGNSYLLPGCLPGCVLITLNGARTLRLGDHNWAFKQPFFISQNFRSPSLKTSTLPAATIPPPHPVYSNGWQPSVRRRTFWCLFEIFFSLTWVNALWFFLKCPVQNKIPTIWQTVLWYSEQLYQVSPDASLSQGLPTQSLQPLLIVQPSLPRHHSTEPRLNSPTTPILNIVRRPCQRAVLQMGSD